MPSVVDELVVTLGLDPAKFQEGNRKVADSLKRTRDDAARSAKDLEASGARAGEGFFGKIKSEALSLFAVLIGAESIGKFVSGSVTAMTAVSNAATAVGLDPRRLQAFGLMIEAMGGSAATARQEMTDLAKTMQGWVSGTAMPSVDFLMGMSQIHLGRGATPEQIFAGLAKFAETHTAAQTSQEARRLGFGQDADTVEAMKGQVKVLADLQAAMDRTPSDKDIARVRGYGVAGRTAAQEIQSGAQKVLAGDFKGAAKEGVQERRDMLHAAVKAVLPGAASSKPPSAYPEAPWHAWLFGHHPAAASGAASGEQAGVGGLPRGLLAAIYAQESGSGRHSGLSSAGALGLAQFMPATARRFGVTDRTSYAQESVAAAKYLSWLIKHFGGDVDKAIAGYNAGEGRVDKAVRLHGAAWRQYLPPETKSYIANVDRRLAGGGTTVNIGTIHVNAPNARDAKGVAAGIVGALKTNLPVQAAGGLSG